MMEQILLSCLNLALQKESILHYQIMCSAFWRGVGNVTCAHIEVLLWWVLLLDSSDFLCRLRCTVKQFHSSSSTFPVLLFRPKNKGINGEHLRQIEIKLFKHHKRPHLVLLTAHKYWHWAVSDRDCYCFCMN